MSCLLKVSCKGGVLENTYGFEAGPGALTPLVPVPGRQRQVPYLKNKTPKPIKYLVEAQTSKFTCRSIRVGDFSAIFRFCLSTTQCNKVSNTQIVQLRS